MKPKHILPFLFVVTMQATAGPAGDEVRIEADRVADGLYMLRARGGNIGVSTGADGVFLIDDQLAPLTRHIRGKLDELADGKAAVRFVLNTHVHGDHTGGNENLGKAGALIVAHENVRRRMSTDAFREEFLASGGESLDDALPVVTFNDRIAFHVNGRELAARHYPHAHTDGDTVIWFRDDNVVHMGDIFFEAGYPFIDLDRGGSVNGLIAAVEDVLEEVDDDTTIMPGHGQITSTAALRAYRDMLTTLRDRVREQLDLGRSLDEARNLNLTREFDERWSWSFIDGERFVETLYRDLSGETD